MVRMSEYAMTPRRCSVTDFYLNERILEHRVTEEHRRAELRRQKKEAKAGRTNWLCQQRYRIVNWLGCHLSGGYFCHNKWAWKRRAAIRGKDRRNQRPDACLPSTACLTDAF